MSKPPEDKRCFLLVPFADKAVLKEFAGQLGPCIAPPDALDRKRFNASNMFLLVSENDDRQGKENTRLTLGE